MSITNNLTTVWKNGTEKVHELATAWNDLRQSNPTLAYGIVAGGALALYGVKTLRGNKPALITYETSQDASQTYYDVAIVGAGPSGSVCGYYLAKHGKKVVCLEKKKFPRDKYCGDAITYGAQLHMQEMGALQEILAAGEGHWANNGGFVSTTGVSFIGNSAERTQNMGKGRVMAIKRIHMDEKVARGAIRAGVNLIEEIEVTDAKLDKATGLWTVFAQKESGEKIEYQAKVLVCADGAPSRLARHLGLVHTEPDGVCSRSYVAPGTHNFKCDGVVFYNARLLPGYSAVFRHPNDELGFCTYIIPGGEIKNEDLKEMHEFLAKQDPYVSKALGPNAKLESMKAGALRLGGIPKSYADQLLIIGDAAGHIDPLTGEGIQYAMDGAKFAADTIVEAMMTGDLSERQMKKYHKKWVSEFGHEFYWSMKMSLFLYRFPIILDAAAAVIQKRGAKFLAEWALVMTGGKSKLWFLRPDVGLLIFLEAIKLAIQRKLQKPAVTQK